MGFKFTGAPPALLARPSEHSPFASFSGNTHPATNTNCFTPPTSSWTASGLSFGSPGFCPRIAATPENTSSVAGQTVEAHQSQAATGSDFSNTTLLSRALRRAETSTSPFFGRREAAADQVLKGHVRDKQHAQHLLAHLYYVHPTVSRFIESLFDKLVEHECPAAPLAPALPPRVESNFAQAVSADGQAQNDENADILIIPRAHPSVQEYGATLKKKLLDERFVHHEEGAFVLASFIINELYTGERPLYLGQMLMVTLGATSAGKILRLVQSIDDTFRRLDAQFRAGELGDVPPEEPEEASTPGVKPAKVVTGGSRPLRRAQVTTSIQNPFRFMDLPPELRNRVYTHQLAPNGIIVLPNIDLESRCRRRTRGETAVQLSILRVCEQVYKEAKGILHRNNTICVMAKVSTSTYPCIDHEMLRLETIPLLASMTLVLDFQGDSQVGGNAWIHSVHWQQLQKLTTLKHLRICFVESACMQMETAHKRLVLMNVLERIPADCQLTFESHEICEIDFVQEVIEAHERWLVTAHRSGDQLETYEVEGDALAKLAKQVKSAPGFEAGCKNGHERDYRFPPKPVTKTLQELLAEGVVDPKIVLGGSN